MDQAKTKAIIERAGWTFAQSFGAVFLAGISVSINQVQLKALLIAAIAAGLSALKNVLLTPQEVK